MPLLDSLKEALKTEQRPKSGSEVLQKLIANLQVLETERDKEKSVERALDSISKYLVVLKSFLFSSEGHEVTKDSVLALAREASRTNLLYLLVKHLCTLSFESRKDVGQCFSAIVRIKDDADGKAPGAQFIASHPDMLEQLLDGCGMQRRAVRCGCMHVHAVGGSGQGRETCAPGATNLMRCYTCWHLACSGTMSQTTWRSSAAACCETACVMRG